MENEKHTPGQQTKEMGTQKRHPFSLTLGVGPYRYIGSYDLGATLANARAFGDTEQAFRNNPPPKVEAGMGTCAHCGHAILDIRIVRRGDGKLYGVGSDCILKVASEGDVGEVSKLERQIRADNKRKRQAREQAKKDALTPDFEVAIIALENLPHPNAHFAGQGKTLADYYRFVPRNAKNMKAAITKARGE